MLIYHKNQQQVSPGGNSARPIQEGALWPLLVRMGQGPMLTLDFPWNHTVPQLEHSSDYEGAKNLSYSSLYLKAAICPVET